MGTSNQQLPIVHIFYGCDNRFVPFFSVSLLSLIKNRSLNRIYDIHVLHTDISKENQDAILSFARKNVTISFDDVSEDVSAFISTLPVRDYYSPSTYYRLVIANKFKDIDKALYIDSDTAIVGDVAKLYDISLGNKWVGAIPEAVMTSFKEAGQYAEKALGIRVQSYFNAGIILINSRKWREVELLKQFAELAREYDFPIAQDQDYLNVLCHGHCKILPRKWNMEAIRKYAIGKNNYGIVHYAFAAKPWHDFDCLYGEYFWKAAAKSPYYKAIKLTWANYTPEQLENEKAVVASVMASCLEEVANPHNYFNSEKRKRENFRASLSPVGAY